MLTKLRPVDVFFNSSIWRSFFFVYPFFCGAARLKPTLLPHYVKHKLNPVDQNQIPLCFLTSKLENNIRPKTREKAKSKNISPSADNTLQIQLTKVQELHSLYKYEAALIFQFGLWSKGLLFQYKSHECSRCLPIPVSLLTNWPRATTALWVNFHDKSFNAQVVSKHTRFRRLSGPMSPQRISQLSLLYVYLLFFYQITNHCFLQHACGQISIYYYIPPSPHSISTFAINVGHGCNFS